MCVQLLSHARLFTAPWTVARQAPLSMGFPRQELWGGLPFSTLGRLPHLGSNCPSCISCIGWQILYWRLFTEGSSQSHLGSLCLLTPLSNTVLGHGGTQVTPEMYWVTSSWFFSLGIQRYSVCHPLHSFIQCARMVIKSQKRSQQPVLPLIPQKDGNKRKCETLCPRNRGLPAGSSPWSWESPCAWGVRLKTRRDYCPPSPFLFTASWLDFPHHPDSTVHFCILFLFNENIKEHIKPQSKI